jgi:hypothetical protein
MMIENLQVISYSEHKTSDIDLESMPPEFRKASVNMAAATLAFDKCLGGQQNVGAKIGIVVGTHFGEVEASLDFLYLWQTEKVAKPILFQNSLHNSTMGFLSKHFGIKGPGMSISSGKGTYVSSWLALQSLAKDCDSAFLCMVDHIPQELVEPYLSQHPYLMPHLNRARVYWVKYQSGKRVNPLEFIQ